MQPPNPMKHDYYPFSQMKGLEPRDAKGLARVTQPVRAKLGQGAGPPGPGCPQNSALILQGKRGPTLHSITKTRPPKGGKPALGVTLLTGQPQGARDCPVSRADPHMTALGWGGLLSAVTQSFSLHSRPQPSPLLGCQVQLLLVT